MYKQGIVFLIAAGVWHWIYFMSGYGFAAVFRDAVDEMMFDITFTFMDIGLPMHARQADVFRLY